MTESEINVVTNAIAYVITVGAVPVVDVGNVDIEIDKLPLYREAAKRAIQTIDAYRDEH